MGWNKAQWIGCLAYQLSALLRKSLTIRIEKHQDYDPKTPYLFAFWHGKQWLPVVLLRSLHQTPGAALVSASKDGDMLAAWLSRLGYELIRGSSRRGNVSALFEMRQKLKAGYSIGTPVDGPTGPIYQVKPGMTHLAQKLGIGIIPVGMAFSHAWILKKAWDRYEIPKPFARAVFYLGEPLFVPQEASLEDYNRLLEERIRAAEAKAAALLSDRH